MQQVIDLAGSHQPMSNEDNTVCLVFNGEIYNYRELRQRLIRAGHAFTTEGDGETIVHLYEDYGLEFVSHLNGMFAVALWDSKRNRLVLARDRLGIKPLYYALDGQRILFASETKSILEHGAIPFTLDRQAIAAYMNYSTIPGPDTCVTGIKRLPPGHVGVFDRAGFELQEYWDIDFSRQRRWRPADLLAAMDEQLRDAVRMRMISDVPLGVFLSGGVDSSLIAAMMSEFSTKPVEAFSIGFGKEGAYMNEVEYARTLANRYGMHHHELILDSESLLSEFERVVWHLDEPCGDPAAFLTLALSDFTRKHVTVALSGLGGDELFAGYRRYLGIKWQDRYLRLPETIRTGLIRPLADRVPEGRTSRIGNYGRLFKKFVFSVDRDLKRSWANTTSYLPPFGEAMFTDDLDDVRRSTYTSGTFERYWARSEHLPVAVDRVMYMDMKMYLVDQLLMQQDKMSMASSLEARVPFLDHRFVELAATVPAATKVQGGQLKAMLKQLAEKYVPKECIYRPKKGFAAPLDAWLRGPLKEQLHDALSPLRVRDRGIFRVEFIEWMKREFYENGRDLTIQLYQAFLLEIWLRLFADGDGRKFAAESARADDTRHTG